MISSSRDLRWSHQANVQRYRRLLQTSLTDIERQYVRRRLAEERRACQEIPTTEPQVKACWFQAGLHKANQEERS